MYEKELYAIWAQQRFTQPILQTIDGFTIRVIYPGHFNINCGPDFQGAKLVINGRIKQGDVELHVAASDWKRHCHHTSSLYNNVILHVVYATPKPGEDISGAPILVLKEYMRVSHARAVRTEQLTTEHYLPCYALGLDPVYGTAQTGKIIYALARERFRIKVNRIPDFWPGPARLQSLAWLKTYAHKNPDDFYCDLEEVLYILLMYQMGIPYNVKNYLHIARHTSYQTIRRVWQKKGMTGTDLKNQFLKIAGFSPAETDGLFPKLLGGALRPTDWNLYRLYPTTYPQRRLIILAQCLYKSIPVGLLNELISIARRTGGDAHSFRECIRILFSSPGKHQFSQGTINSLTHNIFIPILAFYGVYRSDTALLREAIRLYANYPKMHDNYIIRRISRQLYRTEKIARCFITKAYQQQGMIRLYRQFCKPLHCTQCGLAWREKDTMSEYTRQKRGIVKNELPAHRQRLSN